MPGPNFFIVGAPKCGTTALAEYLRTHPQVFLSLPKEPCFWSRDIAVDRDLGFDIRTLDEYLQLFAKARPSHLRIGEASTTYLWSETAVPDIMQFAPDCSIIAMVRNPIEMAQALHQEEVFSFVEDQEDFETAWSLQPIRARGGNIPARCCAPQKLQYRRIASLGTHVQKLFQHVPQAQRLVIVYDDFAASPAAEYARVLRFLGLPHDSRSEFPRVNARKRHRNTRLARALLRPPQSCAPIVCLLRTMIRRTPLRGIRSGFLKALSRTDRPAPLSPVFRRHLADTFRDEVYLLGDLLGRDLLHWLNVDEMSSPSMPLREQTVTGGHC